MLMKPSHRQQGDYHDHGTETYSKDIVKIVHVILGVQP